MALMTTDARTAATHTGRASHTTIGTRLLTTEAVAPGREKWLRAHRWDEDAKSHLSY
jgi:hypothetical protein